VAVEIALATRDDLPDLVMLVRRSGLSAKGLETCRWVLKATTDGRIVGTGAVEVLGRYAFCRSLAVERSQRGNGVGTRIVQRWLELCREEGLEAGYLVTRRWHAGYFARWGFRVIAKREAPPEIKRHWQVSSLLYRVAYRPFVCLMRVALPPENA
jgi:N-acetylglutamate synthase-like GNAT family acetyltransferase